MTAIEQEPTSTFAQPITQDGPVREFRSIKKPHTPENLQKARKVLARAQEMDWLRDAPPNCAHKTPCFPVADMEWLFGYVDHLQARIAELETK